MNAATAPDALTAKHGACPHCGASVASATRYGWGEYIHWRCGRVVDDGPGRPCPSDPSPIRVDGLGNLIRDSSPDEPETVETLPAKPIPNELSEIEKIRAGLVAYMGPEIEQDSIALVEASKAITIEGHVDGPKAGREAYHDEYMKLVRHRTQRIEAEHSQYKGPVTKLGSLIDSRKRDLLALTEPREKEMKKVRDDWDKGQERQAEEKRKRVAAEKAAKLQDRINAAIAAGYTPDAAKAATLTDEEWDALHASEAARAAEDKRVLALAKELTDLGAPTTMEEARALSLEAAEERLENAREAKRQRDEEDRQTRERLELGSQRLRTLSLLGMDGLPTQEQLSVLTEESFERIREIAEEAKRNREKKAEADRLELSNLRQKEADARRVMGQERATELEGIAPGYIQDRDPMRLGALDAGTYSLIRGECEREARNRAEALHKDAARRERLEPSVRRALAWVGALRDVPPMDALELEPEVQAILQAYAARHLALVDDVLGKLGDL